MSVDLRQSEDWRAFPRRAERLGKPVTVRLTARRAPLAGVLGGGAHRGGRRTQEKSQDFKEVLGFFAFSLPPQA